MVVTPDDFIEEFHAKRAAAGLGGEDGVTVVLATSGWSAVSVDQIKVDPALQQKGLGSRVLALLIEMSNRAGLDLEVIPSQLPGSTGMSNEQLAAWYARSQFVDAPTPDVPRRMLRKARA